MEGIEVENWEMEDSDVGESQTGENDTEDALQAASSGGHEEVVKLLVGRARMSMLRVGWWGEKPHVKDRLHPRYIPGGTKPHKRIGNTKSR